MTDFLSRGSLIWLLAALCASLLLHAAHLPLWILLAAIGSFAWRLLMHAGRLSSPHKIVKFFLVIGSFTGIYLSYLTAGFQSFSLESMVALFSIGAVLKPVEVSTQRDTYVLIFLCYFLAAIEFLFDQNPQTALAVMATLILTMSAQVSLNLQSSTGDKAAHKDSKPLAMAVKIIVQSIPLAIILFIFVPRVGPLWALTMKTQAAKIGLSNFMTPGDIANLSASDELAFIAKFDDQVPANEDLYWRALVLDEFDGKTWSPSESKPNINWIGPKDLIQQPGVVSRGETVGYSVMIEPHDQKWLFALDKAYPQTLNTGTTDDFRMVNHEYVRHKIQYRVESDLNSPLGGEVLEPVKRFYLTRLPQHSLTLNNPKTRTLAARLQMTAKSDQEYIKAVQDYFLNRPFVYTLKPDLLGDDNTIDQFLFQTQNGFCAHYAGSFTYLMRLGGIPARIVTGYQGGEFNSNGGYMAVYQYNAHAWVEVWIESMGWVRIDPTTFVAPERVRDGIEQGMEEEFLNRHLFSSRNWPILNDLRKSLQAFDVAWNTWILSYTKEKQESLLKNWFGDISLEEYAGILLGLVLAAIAMLSLAMWWVRRPEPLPPIQGEYQRLLSGFETKGLSISPSDAPSHIFQRACDYFPEHGKDIQALARLFDAYLYGFKSEHFTKTDLRVLKQRIRRLRSRL